MKSKSEHAKNVRTFFINKFSHLDVGIATLESFYYVFCRSGFYVYDDLKQLTEVFFETLGRFVAEYEISTDDYLLVHKLSSDCLEVEDGYLERLPTQKSVGSPIGLQMDLFVVKQESTVNTFVFSLTDLVEEETALYFVFKTK